MSIPMELKDLESFMRIARAGSLSKAAQGHSIPKATLSNQLRRLEDSLSVQLFIRRSNFLELTNEGRDLLRNSRRIFEACEHATDSLKNIGKDLQGTFRIAASPEFGTSVIGPIIHQFIVEHPLIEVSVEISPTDYYFDDDHDLDCMIFIGDPPDSYLIRKKLGMFRYGLYASPKYVWDMNDLNSPAEISKFDALIYQRLNKVEPWQLRNGKDEQVLTPESRLSVNDYWLLKYLAVSGVGLAYLPNFFVVSELAMNALLPVLTDWQSDPVPIYALYPKQRHKSKVVQMFIQYWVENFERLNRNPPYSLTG